MNHKTYWSVVCVILIAALSACEGGNSTPPPPVETIVSTSGSAQSTVISTAFANPLVATVSTGETANSGVTVTFTAPSTGASGTFGSGATTATATTDSNGVATSPTFTANATAGGPYTVTATVSGVTSTANFSLTNTTTTVATSQFSFYLSGLENENHGPNFYALAGAVTIDADGNVLGGEQDFNDAIGFTSPQPSGDSITGGSLSVDGTTGQGTLTLITNNAKLGSSGTETLGVQFVSASHALLIQFDGSATSSGSLDLQTLPSTLSGGYAFTVSGVDSSYDSVVIGGVFSINGTSLTSGVFDLDDNGAITTETSFTGTVSAPDSFGRGTVTATSAGTPLPATFNYYIIGTEAMRVIDVDAADSAVGSAFGQGASAGTFTNSSLQASVFNIQANPWGNLFAAAGQISTTVAAAKPAVRTEGVVSNAFSGVGDDNELEAVLASGTAISGTYTINTNGYGSLSITSENLGDVAFLGIYMVDPKINVNDPNNTAKGAGGALVADLDVSLNGIGVIVPQTDNSTASFAGHYAFGAQDFFEGETGWEFDFIGQGTVTSGALSGTGLLSDPFGEFGSTVADSGVTFAGTADPDFENVGRYTMATNPLATTIGGIVTIDFTTVIYQADGGQLFWVDEDSAEVGDLFGGTLQQQGSLTGLPQPAAKKAAANAKPKQK